MRTPQRVVLIITLFLLAWMMHTSFCEWVWREGVHENQLLFGGFFAENQKPTQSPFSVSAQDAWGVRVEYGTNRTLCILLGMVLPLALLCIAVFLAVGMRHARRREHGMCLRCGFDLKYNYDNGCPECGWRRQA